jgi:uncharacterized protein
MLIDLTKLHGQREHVERRFEPSAFDPPDEEYRVAAPVELTMDVEKAGHDTFRVHGRATTSLELECSRCLEPFTMPVEATFDLRYLPAEANEGEGEHEIEDDDLDAAYYRDGVLDVIDLLREQFQLALPMKPLCSEACKGLCSECGTNLNKTQCDCTHTWEDPRLAALKGLLQPEKEN